MGKIIRKANLKRNEDVIGVFFAILVAFIAYLHTEYFIPEVVPSSANADLKTSKVITVSDGDTIVLESNERVRLIGIDAPELQHTSLKIDKECLSDESTSFLKNLIEGKEVKLENDVTNKDKYDRLLRYVYIDDIFVNEEIVKNGYARSYDYVPDTKYQHYLESAENFAKKNKLGIHSALCK